MSAPAPPASSLVTLAARLALLALAAALPWSARAADPADAPVVCDPARTDRPTVGLRIDNDLFAGSGQDQGYSNGFLLTLVSPNLNSYVDDPCLPPLGRRVNRLLPWLHPERYEQQNMVFSLAQGLFTPADKARTDLIVEDRPYAAALLLFFGYNARRGDQLRHTRLGVGIVGPSARGREVQDAVHRLIGSERFLGWRHQLRDEPVLQLAHERLGRRTGPGLGRWRTDVIGHWGVGVGNLSTYANVGVEWRAGLRLPDDFGSSPLRLAGENTAPPRAEPAAGWGLHAFLSLDGSWVLRDITLDGNTFKTSHRVDRRPLVATLGTGLALTHGRWKFALARYHRTREFATQHDRPAFGSFTISRKF